MTRLKIKSEKGVTLTTLAITVTVLMILVNVVAYNVGNNLKLAKLEEMKADIDNLRGKISTYYAQYGKIPAKAEMKYENIENIKNAGVISEKIDTGEFLVIDLSAIENLTLNKGKDFKKISENTDLDINEYKDLYIINETSHNIFYVAGITVNDKTYYTDYTDKDVDQKAVDLHYIDGVKIPDGFFYIESKKDEGIWIQNEQEESYQWIAMQEEVTKLPEELQLQQGQNIEDFIKSVNCFKGYYRKEDKVIYLEIKDKWTPEYDKEGIYQDKAGDVAYIPEGFCVSQLPGENTIDDGLVVKDSKQNEWVWIEVPKSIYKTATSSEDYYNIENDMKIYASDYRTNDYQDQFYSSAQHGFSTEEEYNSWKNSMLKSVYEKGGFYIGRYEVGIDTPRNASSSMLPEGTSIQQGKYPCIYVTCSQAQELAESFFKQDVSKKSSLMFGIQWDLVMKFIESKEAKIQEELNSNSSSWGNYFNSEFDIMRGKYSSDNGVNFLEEVPYKKLSSEGVLLSMGETERNSALNIYDLAGNVWEWTLEYTGNASFSCGCRGGSWKYNGFSYPASSYGYESTSGSANHIGFRPTLW